MASVTTHVKAGHPQPLQHADIHLYSVATPNGVKISIALEELGLPYEAHTINIRNNEQFNPDFLKISPNNKIPAIVDNKGPDGNPISLFETGAILIYLAEKTGKLLSHDPRKKYDTLQWLIWQVAGFGPMLGQMGHFHKYAKEDVPYGKQRYLDEAKRLYGVLEKQLEGKDYIVGEYSIADIATWPWVWCVEKFYGMKDEVGHFPNIERWYANIAQREAVKKGITVCPFT